MRNFKKIALMMSASALIASTPASAGTFIFDYAGTSTTNGPFTASLLITESGGIATAISGTRNGIAVTGLSTYAGATQAFSSAFPFTNFGGLSYSTLGGPNFNVYFNGTSLFELNSTLSPGGFPDNDGPITSSAVAAVPEPATWALLLLGFFAVGGAMRAQRRKPNVSVSFA